MSKKAETLFKEKVLKELEDFRRRRLPIWVKKINQVSLRGVPDLLLCVNGRFMALELKAHDKSRIDRLQMHNINLILYANGEACICTPEQWPSVRDSILEMLIK